MEYLVFILFLLIFNAISKRIDKSKPKKVTKKPSNHNSYDKHYSDGLTERQIEYREYLKSEQWANTRAAARERAGNKCQICSDTNNLNVHHNTYANIRNERPEDLVVLCRKCHSLFHNKPA